jgi:hypothetical protein
MSRVCAQGDGFDWNLARVIGAAIKSQSRRRGWLCCEEVILPGKKLKTK